MSGKSIQTYMQINLGKDVDDKKIVSSVLNYFFKYYFLSRAQKRLIFGITV